MLTTCTSLTFLGLYTSRGNCCLAKVVKKYPRVKLLHTVNYIHTHTLHIWLSLATQATPSFSMLHTEQEGLVCEIT